jgi:TIGR00341 family protein
MLVVLSTLVGAVGLARKDLAVLIRAMLIAPLLGPYLAVAFATSVGDRRLLLRGLKSAAVGLALTVALAALVPFAVAGDLDSGLLERTARVGLGSVVLPLASGAAAAQSITSRVSSLLVGVMVSSALLPPATALGIALSGLAWDSVAGAGLLLSVNVVAVTLAAILTFTAKGIRPRTWYEREGASQSLRTTLPLLALALAGLVAVIAVTPRYLLG